MNGRFRLWPLLALVAVQGLATEREQAVCGGFLEPMAFALWSGLAPEPDPGAFAAVDGVEPYTFTAGDGKRLRGYVVRARDAPSGLPVPARGYVLVALGNAMTASHLVAEFAYLSGFGFDVFLVDYRGYGDSEGRRRLRAFTVDYRELAGHLAARYRRGHLIGLSLGGIVVLNAIGAGAPYTRAVVDAAPSTVSGYLCPARFDPVANVPEDASGLMMVVGDMDRVVPAAVSAALVEHAAERGARVARCAACGHPFMDVDPELRAWRLQTYADFVGAGP